MNANERLIIKTTENVYGDTRYFGGKLADETFKLVS